MNIWSVAAEWAISSTVQTALIVGVLTGVTLVAGRHLSPRWGAALWMLVVIRLAVPWSPASLFALHSFVIPAMRGGSLHLAPVMGSATAISRLSGRTLTSTVLQNRAVFWPWIVVTLWGVGASLLAVRSIWREIYFRRILAAATERVDLQESLPKSVMGIWEHPAARAPAVFGLWRPIIVVPPGLIDQLTPQQLQWVLRHELNHIRRRDIATRWAMELVAIIYWFNPFVWIARSALRTAHELAADNAVVHDLPPEQRLQYGRLLLAVATYNGGAVPSMAEMQLRRPTLARRLRLIRHDPNRRLMRAVTLGSVVFAVVLAVSGAGIAAMSTTSLRPPAPPPTLTNEMSSQSTRAAGAAQGAITAGTFTQAIQILLAHEYSRPALAHLRITGIETIHNTYAAQVLVPDRGQIFMGSLVATRQGTQWTFQSSLRLSWVNPSKPMTVMSSGGQITQTSTPYLFIAGAVTRSNIHDVVIQFDRGTSEPIPVSPIHTFTYLTQVHQAFRHVDAYSASHGLVYRG